MTHGGADTIAAVATPPGRGGVGIVRVSGPRAFALARQLTGRDPEPGRFRLTRFLDAAGEAIDEGLLLAFRAPRSFTGEDVVELQGHGGPVVMDLLLARCLELGARAARPGEFSERAFLNGRMDLTRAEAIADLIEAETRAGARLAMRSLEGAFARRIEALADAMVRLRTHVEAAIDFPEEEIDFLSDPRIAADLDALVERLAAVREAARVGRVLREGLRLVIAGPPNAGKSSLLNALSGGERAIVTEVPGTTRDALHERIDLDGLPVHLVDTAGLRETDDRVERIGIERARAELERADRVLWVYDGAAGADAARIPESASLPPGVPVTRVHNKVDLSGAEPGLFETPEGPEVRISAREGTGLPALRAHLRATAGLDGAGEGAFMARRRHLEALDRAAARLADGRRALAEGRAGELLAEDLRLAHAALGEITGTFSADDLLGEIFSSFCIGK